MTPPNVLALNARILFAFETAFRSVKLPDRETIPHLLAHDAAVVRACELWGSARCGWAFATTFRRVLTDAGIAGLKPKGSDDGETWLAKPINNHLALRIGVDRNREFHGYGFTLLIGVEILSGPAAGLRWSDRFLAFTGEGYFGRGFWVFGTKADLEESFAGAARLLLAVLPALEDAIVCYVDPAAEDLHADIPVQIGLSAREAYERVLPLARAWNADASLHRLLSGSTYHGRWPSTGIDLDPSGRLTQKGAWRLQFWSPSAPAVLNFELPACGLLVTDSDPYTVNSLRYSPELTVPADFINSDHALHMLSPYLGGDDALAMATLLELQLRVDYYRGQVGNARWEGRLQTDNGRNRWLAMIDAKQGLPVQPLAPKG